MIANPQYVDKELLDEKISNSGYRIDYIVNTLGISRQAFHKKCHGVIPFRVSEVYVICDILGIKGEERSNIFRPMG